MGGVAGIGALYCYFRGLAVGAISIVVPISGLCVVLPVIVSLMRGDALHPVQGLGIVIAVGGGLLVSIERNGSAKKKQIAAGILPAFGTALGYGIFYVVMDLAGAVDPLWAATVSRASFLLIVLPAFFYKRPPLKIKAIHLPVVIAIGLLDGTAAFAYTVATTQGMLSMVSVISSLYPVVAIILAALVLKERLRRSQFFGVLLTIIGITCISAF